MPDDKRTRNQKQANSVYDINRTILTAKCLQLKKAGYNYRDIAFIVKKDFKEDYKEFLRKQVDRLGRCVYTDDQIELEADVNAPHRTLGHSDVYRIVMSELQALRQSSIEDARILRELELSRLDDLMHGIAEAAERGDLDSISMMLKITDQRVKLLGLNSPIDIRMKSEISKRLEVEFDAFFGRIMTDRQIPDRIKDHLLLIASEHEERVDGTDGGLDYNYEA